MLSFMKPVNLNLMLPPVFARLVAGPDRALCGLGLRDGGCSKDGAVEGVVIRSMLVGRLTESRYTWTIADIVIRFIVINAMFMELKTIL